MKTFLVKVTDIQSIISFFFQVYDIDHKYMEKCLVKLDKHFRKFEKRAEVSSSQQTIYTNTSNH